MFLKDLGSGYSVIVFILLSSISISLVLITNSKNVIEVIENSHLDNLIYNLYCRNRSRI
jgi:hypothetical protein